MSRWQFAHTDHEASAATRAGTTEPGHSSYIILFLQFYAEDDQWIGDCEALGVMSCGDTLDEARHSLNSLIDLTLGSWSDDGELERQFQERNIEVYSDPLERNDMDYPDLLPNRLLEMQLQPALA